MNKAPDRAKMWREYVRKKCQAYALAISAAFLAVPLLCIGPWLVIQVAVVFSVYGYSRDSVSALELAALIAGLGLIPIVFSRRQIKQATALPYVPPVREQIADLPAEEVLLRSSTNPPASPEELLRPAASHETPTDELLRASAGESR